MPSLKAIPTPFVPNESALPKKPSPKPDHLALAPNQPLHIAWKGFYTGALKNKFLRKQNRPVIISAFAKTGSDAAPAARVIAAVLTETQDCQLEGADAREQGRQTLHYLAAVGENQTFTIEVVSEAGDGKELRKVSALLAKGSTTPLLAMAGGWLAIGAKAFQLGASLVEVTGRDRPVFDTSLTFPVGSAGQAPLDTAILCSRDPQALIEGHEIRQAEAQVGGKWQLYKTGTDQAYAGDEPYLLLQVDQHERPALRDFQAERYAAELLASWVPKEDVDFSELIEVIRAGAKGLS